MMIPIEHELELWFKLIHMILSAKQDKLTISKKAHHLLFGYKHMN